MAARVARKSPLPSAPTPQHNCTACASRSFSPACRYCYRDCGGRRHVALRQPAHQRRRRQGQGAHALRQPTTLRSSARSSGAATIQGPVPSTRSSGRRGSSSRSRIWTYWLRLRQAAAQAALRRRRARRHSHGRPGYSATPARDGDRAAAMSRRGGHDALRQCTDQRRRHDREGARPCGEPQEPPHWMPAPATLRIRRAEIPFEGTRTSRWTCGRATTRVSRLVRRKYVRRRQGASRIETLEHGTEIVDSLACASDPAVDFLEHVGGGRRRSARETRERRTGARAFAARGAAAPGSSAAPLCDQSRVMPALLTRMSMFPSRSATSAAIFKTSFGSPTSCAKYSARRPRSRIWARTSSANLQPVKHVSPTSAPRAASANATALPMPRDPPVTSAVLPARLNSGTVNRCCSTARVASVAMVISSCQSIVLNAGTFGRAGLYFNGSKSLVDAIQPSENHLFDPVQPFEQPADIAGCRDIGVPGNFCGQIVGLPFAFTSIRCSVSSPAGTSGSAE